jgi:hypothetical protein
MGIASMKGRWPLVLSAVLFVLLAAAILIPDLGHRRIPRNHANAPSRLWKLQLAQRAQASGDPHGRFACSRSDLNDQDLAISNWGGYRFEINCPIKGDSKSYVITAEPLTPGVTGVWVFCTDQSGVMWQNKAGSLKDCVSNPEPVSKDAIDWAVKLAQP